MMSIGLAFVGGAMGASGAIAFCDGFLRLAAFCGLIGIATITAAVMTYRGL